MSDLANQKPRQVDKKAESQLTTSHIQNIRNNKKPAYIAFLDVTKAHDKAWLDAILYDHTDLRDTANKSRI